MSEQFAKEPQSDREGAPSYDAPSTTGSAELEKAPIDYNDPNTYPDGGAKAWGVALGAAGVLFCTMGYMNAFGVYQEYYASHQLHNKSPSTISWIGALQSCFVFGGAMFGGPLFDRYGAKIIWAPAILYVFSIMMTSLCKEYYQFILAQGVLGGLANGMTMAPAMAATGQYFNKKRGAAMGMAIAGSSLGGVIIPIALGQMLNNPKIGFGWAVRIIGFLVGGVLLASCLAIRARLPPRKDRFWLLSAFKEPLYLAILGSGFLMMIGVFTPMFYLPTYAVQHGMSRQLAFYLVAIFNAASFFGRAIPGILADRLGRLNMLLFAGISTGILELCWLKVNTNASIIAFAAIFGFCSGAIISGYSVSLMTVPKDPRDIGTYMGMGMAISAVAALIGPPINGQLVSHYHSFSPASIFSGVAVLIGGFGVLLAKQASGKGMLGKI